MMCDRIKSRISKLQKGKLFNFIAARPRLRLGKFSQAFTRAQARQEWENITNILNAMPGARKHWKDWRKTWHDFNTKLKSRHKELQQANRKSNSPAPPPDSGEEGPADAITLSLLNREIKASASASTNEPCGSISFFFRESDNNNSSAPNTFDPLNTDPYAVTCSPPPLSNSDHNYAINNFKSDQTDLLPPPQGFEDETPVFFSLPIDEPRNNYNAIEEKNLEVKQDTLAETKKLVEVTQQFCTSFTALMERQTKAFEDIASALKTFSQTHNQAK